MLVPPVAQGGPGGRQVGDAGARGAQSSVPGGTTTLWPLAPTQANLSGSQQSQATPPLAATPAPAHNQGVNRYELYSLFPGGGGGSYVAATPGTPAATPARAYHATTHKVSESVFSAAVGVGVGGYTWGAPTPPPGSPYSPVPVTQLELLAKNLASLTPHHTQQPLSLQGTVGVNVGASLHHAHHTTQHTLNLAGLHHLHHGESTMTTTSATSFTSKFMDERTLTLGGLHQGTFSPQLSLVTAGTPTLTINSFTTPNAQANVVQSNAGVLLQEYQSPTGPSPVTTCPTTSINASSLPSAATACSVSTMVVQGAQTANTLVQSTTKKRESYVTAQAQIKMENTTMRQSCVCTSSNVTGKTKIVHSEAGCSRTLPVVSSWNGQDTTSHTAATSLIKREPLTATVPCQVAEVSTSLHATTTAVKIEPLSQKSENGIVVSTAATTGIPVGIAVARQRLQHQETSSTSMRNLSLSHHTSHHASYHHFQPDCLGSTTAMAMGGATLVHCGGGGDERTSHLAIPPGALAPSINAALGSTLNSGIANISTSTQPGATAGAAAWPPTLWQYPTAAMPALEPVGFPQLGVGLQGGLQLVRDPSTGHLLLIHAADCFNPAEQMQQAVVWPNYPHHNGHNVGAPPPLLLPPPPPPSLQLLSDMNGARLVLTENKRKAQNNNNVPIVKIEADCGSPNTTIIASAESSKALQTMTTMAGPLVQDAPLLTTLHYYPHAPALVQISQSESTQCRTQHRNPFISKATSPVSCLTPPPEVTPTQSLDRTETTPIGVQDASNQTDAPETDEEHVQLPENLVKQEQFSTPCHQQSSGFFDIVSSSIEKPQAALQPFNLVAKVDKSENTINIPKISMKIQNSMQENQNSLKTEVVSSVDQTIESVISCRSNEPEPDEEGPLNIDENSEGRVSRIGLRVIEITEENCDSFHENLEFFGRRRDPVEQHRRPQFSEELLNKEKMLEEKRREDALKENIDTQKNHEVRNEFIHVGDEDSFHAVSSSLEGQDKCAKVTRLPLNSEGIQSLQQVDSSSVIPTKNKEHPLISVKSFDMPTIDCEDESATNLVVKREKDDLQNSESGTSVFRNHHEKPQKSNEKKTCPEKFHPGIENVVEKLKKNAAAALHDQESHKIDHVEEQNPTNHELPRTIGLCQPRRVELGLKKHILRSCELESTFGTSNNSQALSKIPSKSPENNNDCTSNNNNFKLSENNVRIMKTEKISPSTTPMISTLQDSSKVILPTNSNNYFNNSSERISTNSKVLEKTKNILNLSLTKNRVDLSGLELLSNSIAQLEHLQPGKVDNTSSPSDPENSPTKDPSQAIQNENNNNDVESPLGLLCALAEQRFMEEVGRSTPENFEEISKAGKLLLSLGKITAERKKLEKRKHSCEDVMFTFNKKSRRNIDFSGVNLQDKSREFEDGDADDDFTDSESETSKKNKNKLIHQSPCNKTPQEIGFNSANVNIVRPIQEVEGVDGNSSLNVQPENRKKNWSNMNAMERDMRVRLADIQKKYKEKQKELSKLSPKKEEKRHQGRTRKRSSDYDTFEETEAEDSPIKYPDEIYDHQSEDSLKDNLSSASPNILGKSKCNLNLVKLVDSRSHIKLLDSIPSISIPVPPVSSPITVHSELNKSLSDDEDKFETALDYETPSPSSTITSSSAASKKRKVGRPKKLLCSSGSVRHLTETIVAKKSKGKSSLAGYMMSSKNRLQGKFSTKTGYTPLPFKLNLTIPKGIIKSHRNGKAKIKPVKQTPLHNKNVISSIIAEKAKLSQETKTDKQVPKLKPKLKAEAKLKTWDNDQDPEWHYSVQTVEENPEVPIEQIKAISPECPDIPRDDLEDLDIEKIHERSKNKKRKSASSSPSRRKSTEREKKDAKRRKSSDCKECRECLKVAKFERERAESIINRCKITSAHLAIDQMRVLTAMGGLFYAGRLSAVQAPDVYAITLDGERGNRPHIHSREEILKDAIVEICPTSTKELPPGTRLCAYWSQQYRCLYPGTSVESSEPDSELDEKFVSVEFDDGDSGRIALDDIRLLQPDYPVVEYDPNPLLTLGKRRRQVSSSADEKRPSEIRTRSVSQSAAISAAILANTELQEIQKVSDIESLTLEEYRERKRLKKRRRHKLKRLHEAQDGKAKHRKHKCCDEHRKHKHRKHRKHKHRHNHHGSYSEGSHFSGGESCSGQKSEEEAKKEIPINQEDDPNQIVSSQVSNTEESLPEVSSLNQEEKLIPVEKMEKPKKNEKKGKARERQESVESRSKIAAFLPARQLWGWSGKGYRRPGAKGRAKKQFFKAIQRGSEAIQIGDSAVFLSTGRPDRPYIGRIESMWETSSSNMVVKVKWFYHPEETVGCPAKLKYPGALFESPHMDENDVQTISHKCEVLPLPEYTEKLGKEPHRYLTIYDNNDIYYLAGYYDPTTYLLTMQPGVV